MDTTAARVCRAGNISVPGAITLCCPGARVQDITRLLPTVLRQLLGADTVVVHVGSNDIRRASLELLKMDFKELSSITYVA
jgi:hypothetical protein